MNLPELLDTTGDTRVDAILRGLVALVEDAFPGQARAYLLEGSYADGSAALLSDIDMTVLFDGPLGVREHGRFERLLAACRQISPRALDVKALGLADLAQLDGSHPNGTPLWLFPLSLKGASRLIYGEDVRPALPDVPPEVAVRGLLHLAVGMQIGQRRHQQPLSYPLQPIDPGDEFLGYTRRTLLAPDGQRVPSTKRLLHTTLFAASALVALHSGQPPAGKRDAIARYRQEIADSWAPFLEELEAACRQSWGYRVPEAPEQRAHLAALCRQALGFANRTLADYAPFLCAEARQGPRAARLTAVARLGAIRFPDPTICALLRELARDSDPEIRQAAACALGAS